MHKTTYNRHYKILTWIENEFHKQMKTIVTHETKRHITSVLKAVHNIKIHLEDFTWELSQLRKNEKELIKILQDFYWLNKKIDMRYLINEIKDK